MFDQVRQAMLTVLKSHDNLLLALREYSTAAAGGGCLTDQDISMLSELIARKIYPVPAFSLLVKENQEIAIDTLLARYAGSNVDVERGFGGFIFDLSTMLSDLFESGGNDLLRSLINHPHFSRYLLTDVRFIECLGFALDLESDGVKVWISQTME